MVVKRKEVTKLLEGQSRTFWLPGKRCSIPKVLASNTVQLRLVFAVQNILPAIQNKLVAGTGTFAALRLLLPETKTQHHAVILFY